MCMSPPSDRIGSIMTAHTSTPFSSLHCSIFAFTSARDASSCALLYSVLSYRGHLYRGGSAAGQSKAGVSSLNSGFVLVADKVPKSLPCRPDLKDNMPRLGDPGSELQAQLSSSSLVGSTSIPPRFLA